MLTPVNHQDMYLSSLQKYILNKAYDSGSGKAHDRVLFYSFYKKIDKNKKETITKSLQNLIKKGLIVGFSELTQKKIYIFKIKLTFQGRNLVKKARGEQLKLKYEK